MLISAFSLQSAAALGQHFDSLQGQKIPCFFALVRAEKKRQKTQSKVWLRCTLCGLPTVRSAAAERLFVRWRQQRGYRRGWVSRPERTKHNQSERGTCPLLATVTVANGKTHFAANRRIYRPCEIHNRNFIANPFCRCGFIPTAHSVRVGMAIRFGLQNFKLFSRRKFDYENNEENHLIASRSFDACIVHSYVRL